MEQTAQRPGRGTWTVRTLVAVLPVLALALVGDDRLATVVVAVSCWLPLITVTQHLQLRRPGLLQHAAAVLVDVAALGLLGVLEPDLAPVTLVLLAAAGVLHAVDLRTPHRLLVATLVVAAQLAVGAGSVAVAAAVVAADVVGLVLATTLLTERDRVVRRSNAALDRAGQLTDAVLAGIGEAVVVTDAGGAVTSTNAAAAATFGHEVTGRCDTALGLRRGAGMLDCSRGCPLLDPATGTGQADVARAHPSGTRQALLVNVRAVRGPTGRVREVVHSYRDITSLKRAEEAKTLFLATASHELKTPVAVIRGYVTLLESGGVPAAHESEALATIRTRAEQLSSIIDRLLLASRIEGGGLTVTTAPTDLTAIARERVSALREVSGRDLRLALPDDLPPVAGDVTAIATILDHLVENAIKYSPDGGPVEVSARATPVQVEVEVADHGVGMTPAHVEHAFDAFWQAEGDDTRRFGGSGVGLYIVRSMSRAMGGETTVVRAVPGAGTTFRLVLPRSDVAAGDAPAPPRPDTMVDEFMRQVGATGGSR